MENIRHNLRTFVFLYETLDNNNHKQKKTLNNKASEVEQANHVTRETCDTLDASIAQASVCMYVCVCVLVLDFVCSCWFCVCIFVCLTVCVFFQCPIINFCCIC